MKLLIIGPKGAGKTTFGEMIREEIGKKCAHINIADSLKDVLHHGVGIPEPYMSVPDLKDSVNWGGLSVRKIMQDTGAALRAVDADFFLRAWETKALAFRHVVCSDLRLVREYNYIRNSSKNPVFLIYITAPDHKITDTDITENDWRHLIPHAHQTIVNDKSYGQLSLRPYAQQIVEDLKQEKRI